MFKVRKLEVDYISCEGLAGKRLIVVCNFSIVYPVWGGQGFLSRDGLSGPRFL